MYNSENLQEKWPVLNHPDLPEIKDNYKKVSLLQSSWKTKKKSYERRCCFPFGSSAPTNNTGGTVNNYDPILISLVRRAMPNLIAYDVCSVQPMTGSTGLIFAMKSRFGSSNGTEALFNEPDVIL